LSEPKQRDSVEGGCLCGAVRYRIDGRAGRTTSCHCLHCRRSGGAAFLTWARFDLPEFRVVSGTPLGYESRPGVTRQFCGRCGTQLTYRDADEPHIYVTACSMDDVDGVSPEDHVWCDRMVPWLRIADGLPRYKLGKYDK
jgi:hypothetical protein